VLCCVWLNRPDHCPTTFRVGNPLWLSPVRRHVLLSPWHAGNTLQDIILLAYLLAVCAGSARKLWDTCASI